MSVQSEITRLNTAKSNIATAITNKGVTVPSGTTLDGMAALIDGIETGGSGGTSVETCTINLTNFDGNIDIGECVYTAVIDNEIVSTKINITDTSYTLNNVIRNSLLFFGNYNLGLFSSGGCHDFVIGRGYLLNAMGDTSVIFVEN